MWMCVRVLRLFVACIAIKQTIADRHLPLWCCTTYPSITAICVTEGTKCKFSKSVEFTLKLKSRAVGKGARVATARAVGTDVNLFTHYIAVQYTKGLCNSTL